MSFVFSMQTCKAMNDRGNEFRIRLHLRLADRKLSARAFLFGRFGNTEGPNHDRQPPPDTYPPLANPSARLFLVLSFFAAVLRLAHVQQLPKKRDRGRKKLSARQSP